MRIDSVKLEKMSQKALERKSNKPIMEKKRRARINQCLNQLKSLILEADNERSRHSKLEKADILEMTVKYLQTLRAYHAHIQQLNQLQQQHQPTQLPQLNFQPPQLSPVGSSAPSSPINLQLPQLSLQLSLQAALSGATNNQTTNHAASHQTNSPLAHQLQQRHHHHHHHLHQMPLTTQQQQQISPTWRPW